MPGQPIAERPESLDTVAADLQHLRATTGAISYGEIADESPAAEGCSEHRPRPPRVARTSVYDVFRPGRTRTNPDLVAEIVLALGGDADEVENWRQRCLAAPITACLVSACAATCSFADSAIAWRVSNPCSCISRLPDAVAEAIAASVCRADRRTSSAFLTEAHSVAAAFESAR